MKRLISIVLILILCLTGCTVNQNPSQNTSSKQKSSASGTAIKGIWISYLELNFGLLNETDFRTKITDMFRLAADFGFNAVFVHLRANSDAFYPSALFPWAKQFRGQNGETPGYDTLAIMIETAHSLGLQFHGWINPYRVCGNNTDPTVLAEGTPAKKWLTDSDPENDDWAVIAAGGIYYNPAVTEVQRLIMDGVREIAANYDIDGIHFDDYFYPTVEESFDSAAYGRYCSKAGGSAMSLSDWRRTNVNSLVSGIYSISKSYNKIFGISPAAAISTDKSDRNYTNLYADIPLWMSTAGYVDYIAPQIYFGFNYKSASNNYDVLLDKWLSVPKLDSVSLYIGLAGYKIGTNDAGTTEWCEGTDILARQVRLADEKGCNGFILFSYGSFISTDDLFVTEMNNLKSALN